MRTTALATIVVLTLTGLLVRAEEQAAKKPGVWLTGPAPQMLGVVTTNGQDQPNIAKSMLSMGFVKPKIVIRFPGSSADRKVTSRTPAFEIVFAKQGGQMQIDPNNLDPQAMMAGMNAMTCRPKEVALVRLEVTDEGRSLTVGKSKPIGLSLTKVADLDYAVAVKQPLEPGEYGFFENTNGQGYAGRIWEFSVAADAN